MKYLVWYSIDTKKFRRYFKNHGWTYNSYDEMVRKNLYRFDDLQFNSVAPASREIRRVLETGKISVKMAIQLCQFFKCTPDELGIKVHEREMVEDYL